jgi:hypothetical protein
MQCMMALCIFQQAHPTSTRNASMPKCSGTALLSVQQPCAPSTAKLTPLLTIS